MDYSALEDASLMVYVARRDADALAALFDRYSRLVFSLAVRVLGDPASAEEVTLDTFLRVWNNAAMFNPERGQFVGWLTAVGRHRAIDTLRGRIEQARGRETALNPQMPDPEYEDAFAARLRLREVREALFKIPEPQRIAIELAYFGGLTQAEIAARLNEPLGTVKTRIRLGMRRLAGLMEADDAPPRQAG